MPWAYQRRRSLGTAGEDELNTVVTSLSADVFGNTPTFPQLYFPTLFSNFVFASGLVGLAGSGCSGSVCLVWLAGW